MIKPGLKVTTRAEDLKEGLFGQVVLWTFEVLPYLEQHAILPAWDIKSTLYGTQPSYTVIPGVFDLTYTPPQEDLCQEVSLLTLRDRHVSVLGGDWDYAHKLWCRYFRVPKRIEVAADNVALPARTLGLHYRGTDKNQSVWDTNAISPETFLTLAKDFLKAHPDIEAIFLATDEFAFVEKARQHLAPFALINLGAVTFHKATHNTPKKADRALLDCLLLSRCRYLLKCSSALSGFAKVLNPNLEAYRVSASKLFADIPYFPEAYIPKLNSADPECQRLLKAQFAGDWLDNPRARFRFETPFKAQLRYTPAGRLRNRLVNKVRQWVSSTRVLA